MNRWIARLAPLALLAAAACSQPGAAPHAEITPIAGAVAAAPQAAERAVVRAQLAAHREEQIERLHAYADAGKFPRDLTTSPSLHMFRDKDGDYCAVANLVHQDGKDDLVQHVVDTQNDLVVSDVHDGALYDWMLSSGLTQEELTRIQAPAPYIGRPLPPIDVLPVANAQPAPRPQEGAMTEDQMKAAIRAHVAEVEAELRSDTDKSLEIAVDRYMAAHRDHMV